MANANNSLDSESKKENAISRQVEEYKDIEGTSTKELNFGLWYIDHKEQFRNIIHGFIIAIAIISWVYVIYGFGYYIFKGMKEDDLMASESARTAIISHDYFASNAAEDLLFASVEALKSGNGRYDLIAKVKNPNQRHWAEVSYYFIVGGKTIGEDTNFVLPGEEKYLAALYQEFDSRPDAELRVKNISWRRVDRHAIPDWQDFRDKHLDIIIKDAKFTAISKGNLSEKTGISQLSFTAVNATPYNYREVGFTAIIGNGSNISGINKYNLVDFKSGEERLVQGNWFGDLNYGNKIEIIPEVNIMDSGAYKKFEGGTGEEK